MITVDKIRLYEWIIQAQQWFFLQKLSGFFIIPMPLAILPDIYEIWYFHDNLLSITVPRNFVLSTSSMGLPSILMFTSGWGCFRLEKIMKCVFLIFSDNRLTSYIDFVSQMCILQLEQNLWIYCCPSCITDSCMEAISDPTQNTSKFSFMGYIKY